MAYSAKTSDESDKDDDDDLEDLMIEKDQKPVVAVQWDNERFYIWGHA